MLVAVFKAFPAVRFHVSLARLLFGDDKGGLLAGKRILPYMGQLLAPAEGFNLFSYQARESSLVPAGFLTALFLQKMFSM